MVEMPSDYDRAVTARKMQDPQYKKWMEMHRDQPARMAEMFRNNPAMKKHMEQNPRFREIAEDQAKIRAFGNIALSKDLASRIMSASSHQAKFFFPHLQQDHTTCRNDHGRFFTVLYAECKIRGQGDRRHNRRHQQAEKSSTDNLCTEAPVKHDKEDNEQPK